MKEQVTEIKRQLVLISWDTNPVLVKEQMLKCNLVTDEIKLFVSESVDHILEQISIFSKLAGIISYLKTPLNFTPDCTCCLVEDGKVGKTHIMFY